MLVRHSKHLFPLGLGCPCPVLFQNTRRQGLHTFTLITECYWKCKEAMHGTNKDNKVLETTALNKIFGKFFFLFNSSPGFNLFFAYHK